MTNRLLSPLPRCLNQDIEQERKAPWLNWIEQPPPKGQVAGSNPAGVAKNTVEKQIPVTSLKGGESANRSMGFPLGFLLVVLPSAKRTLCASG